MTDNTQLIQEIKEVIASEGMVDISKITPDATIESLDLKSVDIVMILTALEEKFNVYIPMDGSKPLEYKFTVVAKPEKMEVNFEGYEHNIAFLYGLSQCAIIIF